METDSANTGLIGDQVDDEVIFLIYIAPHPLMQLSYFVLHFCRR